MKTKKKAVKLAPKDYVKTLIWFFGGFGYRNALRKFDLHFRGRYLYVSYVMLPKKMKALRN